MSGVPFILVQRKGWPHKRWEEVLVMPDHPALSPWHLLKAYLALTFAHCPAGSEVLRALKPRINSGTSPSSSSHSDGFALPALSADTIGSLTKTALEKSGVPKNFGALIPPEGQGCLFTNNWG